MFDQRLQIDRPRFGSLKNAILFLGILIPILALFGKGVIGPLLSSFSIVMAAIYAMVCLGVIILRRRTRAGAASEVSHNTVLPYLALCACAAIEVFALMEPIRDWHHGRTPIEWLLLLVWGSWGIWLARKDTSADIRAL